MRIHLQHPDRAAEPPGERPQQRQGDAVLAAERDEMGAGRRLPLDQRQAGGQVAERDLELAQIGDVEVARVDPVLRVDAVHQHAAGAADGRRPVAGAGPVGGADVERHADDADGRPPILARDAEEARRRGEGRDGGHAGVST